MNDATDTSTSIDPAELAASLVQEHVADIVERLNAEPLERASAVLSAMPLERAAEVLDEPGLEAAADLVEAQPSDRAIALLKALSADQRADIFRHLGAAARERLLSELDPETKASLIQLLAYPQNTAGSIMTTEFVSVPTTWTVGETLRHKGDRLCDLFTRSEDPSNRESDITPPADCQRAATIGSFRLPAASACDRVATDRSGGGGSSYLQI
jgi:Mg/Co/Ni transporter MgtE